MAECCDIWNLTFSVFPCSTDVNFDTEIRPVMGESDLPPINPEDEGKYLSVEDGKTVWKEGSGGIASSEITSIKVLDRSEYEALGPNRPSTTLYFIRG